MNEEKASGVKGHPSSLLGNLSAIRVLQSGRLQEKP